MTYLALAAVSYSLPGAVEATGVGRTSLDAAIARGDLIAHYVGTKPVVRAADLDEWIQSLPTERPQRT
jgi:hypothetical protein